MNSRPLPQLAMRPMLPTDVPLLAEIFRTAIEELTADNYSEAQQEAWASAADDEEAFGAKLAHELTLVATYGGAAIGFAALADNRRIDMLYVHPAAAGQGAGAMLCDALEKLAAARGSKELTVDASDAARGFSVFFSSSRPRHARPAGRGRAYYIERQDWRGAAHRLIADGAEALRYPDPREAHLHAARSIKRADVCLRPDGLRLRAYRQCATGDRV